MNEEQYEQFLLMIENRRKEYAIIERNSTLPKISDEERKKQLLMIENSEGENKKRLRRSMSDIDEESAVSIAKQFPGTYLCSCYGGWQFRPCTGKVTITPQLEMIDYVTCQNSGDGGINIMKILNSQGYSLFPNDGEHGFDRFDRLNTNHHFGYK
jgi:hypothetical protein